jgi:glycyl-tRNA synthetase
MFVDPERDDPPLERVSDVSVRLYPADEQTDPDGEYVETTIGEAVDEGVIGSPWVAYYLGVAKGWYERVGVDMERFRFRQHLAGERAHYAADCWDAESEIADEADAADPAAGDWIEIAGFAYRSDYDLSKHAEHSGGDFTVFQQYDEPKTVERAVVDPDMSVLGPEFGGDAAAVAEALEELAERDPAAFDGDEVTVDVDGESYTVDVDVTDFRIEEQTVSGEHVTPHVVEPSFGVDRTVYTVLSHAYSEDVVADETRSFLALEPEVAPTSVGVFPLLNDETLESVARDVVEAVRTAGLSAAYDDSGNIGRRYRRQDEIGTPFCVTVDHEGLEGGGGDTVTVRERDSTDQVRVPVDRVADELRAVRDGERTFADLRAEYEGVGAQA